MKNKFFVIPACHAQQAEDELNQFCNQHRIVGMEKHFVSNGFDSFWSFCTNYLDTDKTGNKYEDGKKSKIDYRELLTESEFACYSDLRNCRKSFAEAEGVPIYAVFTNEQLAQMVKLRIQSKAELAAIELCYNLCGAYVCKVALGTIRRTTRVPLTATGTSQRTRTTIWASALPAQLFQNKVE